jgi:hypothetical protein
MAAEIMTGADIGLKAYRRLVAGLDDLVCRDHTLDFLSEAAKQSFKTCV